MTHTLEEQFNEFCNSNNLEKNNNQIQVIKKLEDYSKNNFKSFISKIFLKKI